jgi:5'-nucleotidase
MKLFRFGSLLALLVLVGTLVPVSLAANSARQAQAPNALVNIQFLNVSDWHAQLDSSGSVGGAAHVSSHWKAHRVANRNTITLTAGDDFGASPPLSGFFDEVPAILAQRMMGIQVNTFGNHNFDRGVAHLQQMIDLAGSPTVSLTPTSAYTNGLPFTYVAANLTGMTGVLTGVERFKIIDISGVKVAIIGLVNEEAPGLVKPGNFGPIVVTNSIQAAQLARTDAAAQGAQVFVAITHKGVTGPGVGPLIDFAQGVTGFDLIMGDHTDAEYNNTINGALVTETRSKGAKYLQTVLTFDTATNTVVSKTLATHVPTAASVVPDPAIVTMLQPYRQILASVQDVPLGTATGYFPVGANVERLTESAVGNLVADAMRAKYGTQMALTNGGGLRSSLPSTYTPTNRNLRRSGGSFKLGPNFDLVAGDTANLLPFGNISVSRNVTGGQLWYMLENGVRFINGNLGRFPQISGFKFTYDRSRPVGSRVLSVTLNDGTQVISDTVSSYSLTTNDFINAGGDGYTMLNDGQGVVGDIMELDVRQYIQAHPVITPTIEGRSRNITWVSNIPDQVVAKNKSTATIPFTIGDPFLNSNPITTPVTLKATSGNTTLVPHANVSFSGTGITRTVVITPALNQTGIATILIEATGKSSGYDTVVVVVNDPPTITSAASVTAPEDTAATVQVGVRDLDTRAQDLVITATPANGILIPAQNLVFSGSGITRTLTITPAADLVGSTTVTIQASDGVSTITKTLDVTFTQVNDAPTISAIADQTIEVGQSTGALTFSIADLDNAVGALTITASSSNTTLVPVANIVIGGSGANRTVTVTPAANQTGTATITLDVFDGIAHTTETFTVTVTAAEYEVFLPFIIR